jgi:hypothetical protein
MADKLYNFGKSFIFLNIKIIKWLSQLVSELDIEFQNGELNFRAVIFPVHFTNIKNRLQKRKPRNSHVVQQMNLIKLSLLVSYE